jgi:hypothetical protein
VETEDGVLAQNACPVDPSFKLAKPDFSHNPIIPPPGVTGLPLGTYMTITIGPALDPAKDRAYELFAINGKPVAHHTTIDIPSMAPPTGSTKFVLHGYETGSWYGLISAPESELKVENTHMGPPLLPKPYGVHFMSCFLVTNWTTRTPRPSQPANHP